MDSSDLSPTLEQALHFVAAPCVHAFNDTKYHASQVRALQFAKEKKSVIMWLVADDRPLSRNIGLLQNSSIDEQPRN